MWTGGARKERLEWNPLSPLSLLGPLSPLTRSRPSPPPVLSLLRPLAIGYSRSASLREPPYHGSDHRAGAGVFYAFDGSWQIRLKRMRKI